MANVEQSIRLSMEQVARLVQSELTELLSDVANTPIDLAHPQFSVVASGVAKATAAVTQCYRDAALAVLLPHIHMDVQDAQPNTREEQQQSSTRLHTLQQDQAFADEACSITGVSALRAQSSATRLLAQCTQEGLEGLMMLPADSDDADAQQPEAGLHRSASVSSADHHLVASTAQSNSRAASADVLMKLPASAKPLTPASNASSGATAGNASAAARFVASKEAALKAANENLLRTMLVDQAPSGPSSGNDMSSLELPPGLQHGKPVNHTSLTSLSSPSAGQTDNNGFAVGNNVAAINNNNYSTAGSGGGQYSGPYQLENFIRQADSLLAAHQQGNAAHKREGSAQPLPQLSQVQSVSLNNEDQLANPEFLKSVHAALSAANAYMGNQQGQSHSEQLHKVANSGSVSNSQRLLQLQQLPDGTLAAAPQIDPTTGMLLLQKNSNISRPLSPYEAPQASDVPSTASTMTTPPATVENLILSAQNSARLQQATPNTSQQLLLQQQLQQVQQQQQQLAQATPGTAFVTVDAQGNLTTVSSQQTALLQQQLQAQQQQLQAALQQLQQQQQLQLQADKEVRQLQVPFEALLLNQQRNAGQGTATLQLDPSTNTLYTTTNGAGQQVFSLNNGMGETIMVDALGNQYTQDNFSLFELQPYGGMPADYMLPGSSSQDTLSMFAAATGNSNASVATAPSTPSHQQSRGLPMRFSVPLTSQTQGLSDLLSPAPPQTSYTFAGQQLDLQSNGALNSLGLNSVLGSAGHLINLNANSNQSLHTASLAGLTGDGSHSEPLPILVGVNPATVMQHGINAQSLSSTALHHANPISAGSLSNRAGGLVGGTVMGGSGLGRTSLTGLVTAAGVRPGVTLNSLGLTAPASPLISRPQDLPGRFKVLPTVVQQRILALCRTNPVITVRDFDDKVVSKLSLLVDSWGVDQALAMLDHLEHRMRTKQGAMKNGPGYLDVAVCSHLDMLKAQGACPKSMKLEDYAAQVLAPAVYHELTEAVNNNRWLAWEHFDQGIIQLVKKLPVESAVEKLQEITYHSFKNVDNIKGCIMSILNSKIREDRRRQ